MYNSGYQSPTNQLFTLADGNVKCGTCGSISKFNKPEVVCGGCSAEGTVVNRQESLSKTDSNGQTACCEEKDAEA